MYLFNKKMLSIISVDYYYIRIRKVTCLSSFSMAWRGVAFHEQNPQQVLVTLSSAMYRLGTVVVSLYIGPRLDFNYHDYF